MTDTEFLTAREAVKARLLARPPAEIIDNGDGSFHLPGIPIEELGDSCVCGDALYLHDVKRQCWEGWSSDTRPSCQCLRYEPRFDIRT